MGKSTIQDVARLAGVSEATATLRFSLSKSASALASGKTHRIMLISGGLNNWFNPRVLQGTYEIFSPAGYDVIPSFANTRQELAALVEKLPSSRNADAIIIASFTLDRTFREALAPLDIPIAGINTPRSRGSTPRRASTTSTA